MRAPSAAAILASVALVACEPKSPTSASTIAGQYMMTGVDGSGMPCCGQTDSAGRVVTLAGGGMEIGWNVPAGTYWWGVVRRYTNPDSTFSDAQIGYSAGTYSWDGVHLILIDSTGLRMTGSVSAGVVTIRRQDHTYEFWRLIEMPH